MVRLKFSIELSYEVLDLTSDFIFNIHAAKTSCQTVVSESLAINQPLEPEIYSDAATGMRHFRLQAQQGPLHLKYDAVVDIKHHIATPESLQEMSISELPSDTLSYIYPSRYCQSDRLSRFAAAEFGHLTHGYERVKAIKDWVHNRTAFTSGSTNASTSAIDTIVEKVGVCRDFAHLMIALCRAVNIPARFVTGIDYGSDPVMGPPDFHAYVEVMLSGHWFLFDPSDVSPPMGLIRLGTGRDAADASFATVFGRINSVPPFVNIEAVVDEAKGFLMPRHDNTRVFSTAMPGK